MYKILNRHASVTLIFIFLFVFVIFNAPVLLDSNNLQWVKWTPIMYFLYLTVGLGLGYHRYVSHSSYNINSIVEFIILLCGSIGNSGSPTRSGKIHVLHHLYSDTINDPHSNRYIPIWKLFFNFKEPVIPPNNDVFKHVKKSSLITFFDSHHTTIFVSWGLLVYFVAGFNAFVFIVALPVVLKQVVAVLIGNVLTHGAKIKNKQSNDYAVNNWILNIIHPGEGYHLNHHLFPNDPNNSKLWYELDPIFWIIKLIKVS